MKTIFQEIKSSISSLWKKSESEEEKTIKRYNIVISICVVFMVAYLSYYLCNLHAIVQINNPTIIEQVLEPTNNPNYNDALYETPNMETPIISVSTNNTEQKVLPEHEFFIGEIVGIKYFGIFGLVEDKELTVNGFVYQVRWKDASHDLPKDDFYGWELYRPPKNSLPISVLQN